jgi:NADPH:quinone reductase-like Zn-dependent oxidoreductase
MRAIIRTDYGSADVMRLAEIDRPTPGPQEVLVRVEAAGLDIGVWHVATGLPLLARLAFGLRAPRQHGLGSELAGVVDAVGAEVAGFRPGDEVFGVGAASFAEYTVAAESKLARKPATVPFADAAASAISGVTALLAVRAAGPLASGERVLVLGASGGVGSFVVQLAHAAGAHVTGVASTEKLDLVRGLGADEVIDYTTSNPVDGIQRYDLVIDMGGNRPLRVLRRALTPRGRVVIVGGEGGGRVLGGFQRAMTAGLVSLLRRQKVSGLVSVTTAPHLHELAGLLASGAIAPAIDGRYALADAPDAMRRLEARQVSGKLVIEPQR